MAVPTITSVTPTEGHTGGRFVIEIQGTNFRLPTDPPATGPTSGYYIPSIQVELGGERALWAEVLSTTRLAVLVPIHDLGTIDVVVKNIDDNGDPIAGESATLANGFTYKLPPLTDQAELTRLVRALILEMRRQIIPEIVTTTHTDYDPETGDALDLIEPAVLPAITLTGPDLVENRLFSLNGMIEEQAITAEEYVTRRTPYTVDLEFGMVGASNHTIELSNLAHATTLFFRRNHTIRMLKDPATPADGYIEYEMDLTDDGDIRITSVPNASNLRTFLGRFVIRGFDLEELAGLTDDSVIGLSHEVTEDPEAETQAI